MHGDWARVLQRHYTRWESEAPGRSQRKLADMLGCSPPTVGRILKGEQSTSAHAAQLAAIVGAPPPGEYGVLAEEDQDDLMLLRELRKRNPKAAKRLMAKVQRYIAAHEALMGGLFEEDEDDEDEAEAG